MDQDLLSNIPLFAKLSPAELAELTGLLKEQRVAAQQPVFWVGDEGSDFYIVQVGRGVKKKQQTAIRRQIAKPIKAWSDAAYLAGDFPHAGYTKQDFPGWTARAAALAARDKDVTTSDFIRQKADQVIADRRDARLFVFSVGGLAGGATAKVYLGMTADLESGKQVRYAVAGQVYLTRKANHWRIFGYDLHRTVLRR